MKIVRISVLLLAASLWTVVLAHPVYAKGVSDPPTSSRPTRVVKDSNGADVEIPYEVARAAPVIGAFAQITQVVTGGDGRIVAAATQNITSYFKEVFPDYAKSNPNNYSSMSVEDLIASGTQVAYGPDNMFSAEQRGQMTQAGIAFVAINNVADVKGMCESFQIIGNILGEKEAAKAGEFISYYQRNISSAVAKTANISSGDKVSFMSLFYSANSYSTTNGRDISNEYIEAAGGINVAKNYMPPAGGNSLAVDAEQIVKWNPQVIMTSNQNGREAILKDPALQTVSAVISGKVYVCPYGIYLWSVRSGEGAMLPLWLGTKLYPDLFADVDMKQVVKDFFKNFYNHDITAAAIDKVLAGDASTAMTR